MKHALHFAVLAMSVAFACATPSTPTIYAKGAYRPAPVRAPAFSPTEEAPHTFEPGRPIPMQPGPRYAPVPHTPKTRSEDTIWAADRPPDVAPTMPFLYGIALPYPELEAKIDRAITDACAYLMMARSNDPGMEKDAWRRWDTDTRRCLAAKLYLHCAHRMVEYYEAHLALMIAMDKDHERMANLTAQKAEEVERRWCTVELPDDVVDYMDKVREGFDAEHEHQIAKLRTR